MNLVYKCNECEKTWNELKSECPDCGSEEYTVIQDDGDPASSFWKWAGLIALIAVGGSGAALFYLYGDNGEWEFEVVQESNNHFEYESNYDELVFTSLVNAQVFTVDGNKVYPSISGGYIVVNSKKKESRTFYFTIAGTPHSDAYNCDCSDLLSFSSDSECNYTAESAKSACNTSLRISFDENNWSNEGDLKFSKSEVGINSKLYYKFSCMPVESVKEFPVITCSIPPPIQAPSVESLNIFLDEEYSNQSSTFREAYKDCIFNKGSDNPIFHYKNSLGDSGPHEFMDLIMFDLEDLRSTNSSFAISSVKYNGDSTRILKVEFNNLN
jgi:hypothetical protein